MDEKPIDLVSMLKQISIILICILGIQFLVGGGFLFFHAIVEMTCVVIGFLMFVFARCTYRFSQNHVLLFLGWAYCFISMLNFFHLITFSGMSVFPGLDLNPPTQFWVAGRFLEGVSFALFPIVSVRRLQEKYVAWSYGIFAALSILTIMRIKVFPVCYEDGVGITRFKITTEYMICLLIGVGIYFLWKRKDRIPRSVYTVVMASMVLTAISELIFTFFMTIDVWNIVGHIPKLISYYFILHGLIVNGLKEPYENIFKRLHDKNLELEELIEKKNKFFGIVTHDLRNPLSIITMSSQILQRSSGLEEQHAKFIQRIRGSSEYMLQLIDELLDLVKIEAGSFQLNLQSANIVRIVENTVTLNQPLAYEKGIQLHYSFEEEIPPVRIDPLKIEQVVNNLISNAIKYSYVGSRVNISLAQNGKQVVLQVADTGQGIPKEELPILFTPYAKISTQATAGEKSTGLGLSISRRIVEGHEGRIWVESEVGRGSTFYVSFPIEAMPYAGERLTS